jgi:hypothetical protein
MKADVAAACEKKSKDEVREAFDQAISASSKAGFLQDAALANELCGEFFAKGENLYWAKHYLTSAYNGYCEWGAEAKSAHLLRDRGVFIDKEQVTGLRSNPTLRKGPLSTKRLLSNMSMTLDDMALDGTTLDGSSSGHLISLTPS